MECDIAFPALAQCRVVIKVRPMMHLFTAGNIPVRAHWAFLLLAAYFSMDYFRAGVLYGVVVLLAVAISILVHEFGHALVARHYKLQPQIILHGFGGLCAHRPTQNAKHNAFIIAAGPGAGLLLGVVTIILQNTLPSSVLVSGMRMSPIALLLEIMFYINIYWSFINLVPLWPLDGGQLYQLGLHKALRGKSPADIDRIVHWTGLVLGVALAVTLYLYTGGWFGPIIGGMLAFQNASKLDLFGRVGTPGRGPAKAPPRARHSPVADNLLNMASVAIGEGDHREALRLAYTAKDERNLSERQLNAMWSILVISSEATEEYDDAVAYSLRAPRSPVVFAARLKALARLGKVDQARRELAAADAPPLSETQRQSIKAVLQ
ncbi:MAG: stage IV sporulation protein FB [Myxococcota bacterium]|jgi:stage IV sporulation protein FB